MLSFSLTAKSSSMLRKPDSIIIFLAYRSYESITNSWRKGKQAQRRVVHDDA